MSFTKSYLYIVREPRVYFEAGGLASVAAATTRGGGVGGMLVGPSRLAVGWCGSRPWVIALACDPGQREGKGEGAAARDRQRPAADRPAGRVSARGDGAGADNDGFRHRIRPLGSFTR